MEEYHPKIPMARKRKCEDLEVPERKQSRVSLQPVSSSTGAENVLSPNLNFGLTPSLDKDTKLEIIEEYLTAPGSNPIINIPFPSTLEVYPDRFRVYDGRMQFEVRDSFKELLAFVTYRWDKGRYNQSWYVGSVGVGKSYNLAALAFYLRRKYESTPIIYISSCRDLFTGGELYIREKLEVVFIDALPEHRQDIENLQEMKDFVTFSEELCENGINLFFIIDDYNFLQQAEQQDYRKFIDDLLYSHSHIFGMSTTENTTSKQPPYSDTLNLKGGLTDNEWKTWKNVSSEFKKLSQEDEAYVKDFTGLIPLYLRKLHTYLLTHKETVATLEEKVAKFTSSDEDLRTLRVDLNYSSRKYMNNPITKDDFLQTMIAAVNNSISASGPVYDKRFFYQPNGRIVPISGYVRKLMVAFLRLCEDDYYYSKNKEWLQIGLANKSRIIQAFCFETYCINKMLKTQTLPMFIQQPLKIIGVENLELQADFIATTGKNNLNKEGSYLYYPSAEFYRYPYVDCVIRVVKPPHIYLFGIQITLQDPKDHAKSLKFFSKEDGLHLNFLTDEEKQDRSTTVHYYLVWVNRRDKNAPPKSRKSPVKCPADIITVRKVKQIFTDEYFTPLSV